VRERSTQPSASERAELLLLAASEAQRVEGVIRPALERGEWVITDRYLYTLLATAHLGLGIDDPRLREVLEFACGGLLPEVVFLLDVEPAIARARQRCQGMSGAEPWRLGRPPQVGAGLLDRQHKEYLALAAADPRRWLVVENTWTPIEVVEERLVESLFEHRERPAPSAPERSRGPRWRSPGASREPGAVRAALLEAADAVARHEAPVAADLLRGLTGAEVDQRRLRFVLSAPGVVAHGLTGLRDDGSQALRHALKAIDPRGVALSLRGLSGDESWGLRLELRERAPREVALSLRGLTGPLVAELREELADRVPSELAASLAGDEGEQAWSLRERLGEPAGPQALARSLTGLDGERAWRLREKLIDYALIEVIESLRGISSERATALRVGALRTAPRAVLESLTGLDDEESWKLREARAERMREAVESTRGLGDSRAYDFRQRMGTLWPSAVLCSLDGLADQPNAQALLFDLLAKYPDDLDALRAAAWVLDPARGA
jgi:dTMP kinase